MARRPSSSGTRTSTKKSRRPERQVHGSAVSGWLTAPGRRRRGVFVEPEHNVVAVDFGDRLRGGVPTGERCLRLYVRRKFPKDNIPKRHLLESEFLGWPVDVIESGMFHGLARADVPADGDGILQPGSAVAIDYGGSLDAGTVGCFLELDGKTLLLSNNHVLRLCDRGRAGRAVFSPMAGAPGPAIGVLAEQEVDLVSPPGKNDADLAVALVSCAIDTKVIGIGNLDTTDLLEPRQGLAVMKYGAGSGYSEGVVNGVNMTASAMLCGFEFLFQGQMSITGTKPASFGERGDSGTMVVALDQRQPVGLLFAKSEPMGDDGKVFCLAAPLSAVLARLPGALIKA